ncbi:hypothetical protein [Roseovarius salinarum]|uniref:hypothetical protein n=1 Tax=Roseovarius salinarum TaxID=1981892 RepID=UPI000C33D2A8|nr:hypothetical protein [Roseovarius salinarum]
MSRILAVLCTVLLWGGAASADPSAALARLEAQAAALDRVDRAIRQGRTAYAALHERAGRNIRNNSLKVLMRTALEAANQDIPSADDLLMASLDAAWQVYADIEFGGEVWQVRHEKIDPLALHDRAMRRSARLRRMTADLDALIRAPLDAFDDDAPPPRSAKPWWKAPDDEPDATIERLFRKSNVIHQLSGLIVKQLDYEAARVREEQARVDAEIAAMRARVPPQAEDDTGAAGWRFSSVETGDGIKTFHGVRFRGMAVADTSGLCAAAAFCRAQGLAHMVAQPAANVVKRCTLFGYEWNTDPVPPECRGPTVYWTGRIACTAEACNQFRSITCRDRPAEPNAGEPPICQQHRLRLEREHGAHGTGGD